MRAGVGLQRGRPVQPINPRQRSALSLIIRLMNKRLLWACCTVFLPFLSAHGASRCQMSRIHDMAVEVVGHRLVVPGTVNRRDTRLMLDTGAAQSFIDQSLSSELELPRKATDIFASGPSGIKYVEVAHVQEVSVGGLSGGKMDLAVVENADGSKDFGMLVGSNFLMQTDIEFNLPEQKVSFFSTSDCEHADLGYWDKDSQVVEAVNSGAKDRRQVFDVLVNGQSVKAIIDSGAPHTSLDIEAATRLGLSASTPGAHAAQEKGELMFSVPLDSIQIGNETIQHERVGVIDFDGGNKSEMAMLHAEGAPVPTQIELLLGLDFLLEHRVLFAVREHKIFFSYIKPKPAAR